MKAFGLFIALILTTTPGKSQEPADQPTQVVARTVEGSRVEIDFGDGRIASFYGRITPPSEIQVGLEAIDTTCTERRKATACTLKTHIRAQEVSLNWKQHPNSSKIGKVIQLLSYSEEEDSSLENFYFSSTVVDNPELIGGGSYLSCDDFGFVGTIDTRNGFEVAEWTSETNDLNEITGVNENYTFSAALGVFLTPNDSAFEITDHQYLQSESLISLFGGDRVGWSLYQGNNNYCDIAFEPTSAKAVSTVRQVENDVRAQLFFEITHENFNQFTEDLYLKRIFGPNSSEEFADGEDWKKKVSESERILHTIDLGIVYENTVSKGNTEKPYNFELYEDTLERIQ